MRKFLEFKINILVAVLTILLSFSVTSVVCAANFPSKTINLIIPAASGGQADLMARTFVHLSDKYLGQPMVIQSRAGGGGAIGSEIVAQSKQDGYTLLLGKANWSSILPAIEGRSKGPNDLDPVCLLNTNHTFLWVQYDSPFKNMNDVLDYAKAHPGELLYGNSGIWSLGDLEWRWINMKANIKTKNINTEGGGKALLSLLGGHVQIAQLSPAAGFPQFKAKKLRPVAYSGPKRHPNAPDVQTFNELGLATGIEGNWHGILAPRGTPKPVIEKLSHAFEQMMHDSGVITAVNKLGEDVDYRNTEAFKAFWENDYSRYKEMAKLFKR